MKKTTRNNKIKKRLNQQDVDNFQANVNRARSVSVGNSFGGTIELTMRDSKGEIIWATLQPVEVIEMIHQLAASVGCHIHIQPRKDFSSWRQWNDEKELLPNGTWAPFSEHPPLAKITDNPEEQPGFNFETDKEKVKRTD